MLRSFARRHAVPLAAAALVALVSVAALAVSAVYALRAARSEAGLRELYARALERNVELTTERMGRIHQLPGGADLARGLLEESIAELEALLAQVEADGALLLQLARAEIALGDVLGNPHVANLGDAAAAEARYGRAEEIAARLPAGDTDAMSVEAHLHRRRAQLADWSGEAGAAADHAARALQLSEALQAALPGDRFVVKDLAFAHELLATLASSRGDVEAQTRHVGLAREHFEQFRDLGGDPELAAFQLAMARISLGGVYWRQQRYPECAAENAAAAAELEPLVAARGDLLSRRERLAWARMWEGSAAYLAGELDGAERALQSSVEHYRRLVELDAGNPQYPPPLANAYHMLGSVAVSRADSAGTGPEAGLAHLERAARLRRSAVDVWDAFEAAGHLAPRHEQAAAHVRRALAEVEERLGTR